MLKIAPVPAAALTQRYAQVRGLTQALVAPLSDADRQFILSSTEHLIAHLKQR